MSIAVTKTNNESIWEVYADGIHEFLKKLAADPALNPNVFKQNSNIIISCFHYIEKRNIFVI